MPTQLLVELGNYLRIQVELDPQILNNKYISLYVSINKDSHIISQQVKVNIKEKKKRNVKDITNFDMSPFLKK